MAARGHYLVFDWDVQGGDISVNHEE